MSLLRFLNMPFRVSTCVQVFRKWENVSAQQLAYAYKSLPKSGEWRGGGEEAVDKLPRSDLSSASYVIYGSHSN